MTVKPRYFVILGAMRTGSNLLEKTLENLGDTVCYGEVYNPTFISGPRKTEVLGHTVATRDADPLGFLERLISDQPKKIAGFRLFVGHSPEVTDFVLRDPRCIRIVLTRDPIDSFISLKIAQKTDQWMLRNPRRRMTTQICFDPAEFTKYRSRLRDHYKRIDEQLAAFGTGAVRIDYSDLGDTVLLQQLASRIGSTGQIPAAAPILRQNPEARAAKVSNYAEMCAVLGFPHEGDPEGPGDSIGVYLPRVLCPDAFSVAYAPIMGNAFEPMIALLHRIEVRDLSRPKLPPPELLDLANRGELYAGDVAPETPVITMVSHPFTRLHAAFVREMFGSGWHYSALRRDLIESHGAMPPPRGVLNGRAKYPAERQQHHFAGFVETVAKALNRDANVPMQADWQPQTELLSTFRKQTGVATVFQHERFSEAADWLTDEMSLTRFPPGQIQGMRQTGRQKLLALENVTTPDLTQAVMALYKADFEQFGYAQYPDTE